LRGKGFHIKSTVIDYAEQKNIPKLETLGVLQARILSKSMVKNGYPKDIEERFSDIKKHDTKLNGSKLRFYYPENSTQSLIIFIHGGGFVIRSDNTYDHVCLMLAQTTNMDVVLIDYKLAPELKFPLIHNNALKDVEKIIESSSCYENIILCGDSAGANIAVFIAELLNKEISQLHLIYPWLDMKLNSESFLRLKDSGDLFLSEDLLKWFRGNYLDKTDYLDNCIHHVDKTNIILPDTYIYACEYDRLSDDAVTFYNNIDNKSFKKSLKKYPKFIHGSLFYSEYVPETKIIINDLLQNLYEMKKT
jgi:acetyl esterase/lipase